MLNCIIKQDHGGASLGTSEESGGLTSEEKSLPVNKEEEVVSDYVSSATTHTFSCEFRPYDSDDRSLQSVPPVSKLKSTSVDSTEDRKSNYRELETQCQRVEFTKPNKVMLSSAMVSVLAPHWSKRNQRTKKGLSIEDFEAQNVARGPHTVAQTVHNRFLEPHRQYRGERVLRDGSHVQERDPLVGPRGRTDGWSSMSGPSSINLNSTTKRLTPLSVSFDVDSRSLDNRDTVRCHNNPKEKTPPPIPSLSLDLRTNERISPTGNQGPLAQQSSKPTTSSLLLSLRKITWRPVGSEPGCRSLTDSNRARVAVPSNPGPSPTSPNNNSSERWISHIPYRPDKNNQNISQTNSVTNLTLSHPQKQIPTNQPGRQEKTIISDNNTDPTRLSQYEQYTILKSQALPRGTTLRSETWWRQVTQEGSSQPSFKDTANMINNNRNETDTPLVTPCNNDSAFLSPNDNRSLIRQIYSHADYNKAETSHRGTHGHVFKRQGGPDTGLTLLRQSNAEDRTEQKSDTFPTHSRGSNLNEKWLQSSPSEVNKVNVNKASFKDNVTKSPVTSLPSNISKTVSANIINHLTANTQAALLAPSPISSPTNMDCRFSEITSQTNKNENQSIYTFEKKSHSLNVNDTVTCRMQKPASSQDTSPQSTVLPRCTYNKPKPLVFERTYPSTTMNVHPKNLSMYQSTISSGTICSPLLTSRTSPTTSSTTPVLTGTTTTSPTPLISTSFLLTPPMTPTPACSPSPKSSLSKRERTFSGSLDISSSTKQSPTSKGKSRRKVTWQDSVDLQQSEDEKGQASVPLIPSPLQKTSPLSLSRSPRSLESPSIFSFLREGSPTEVRQSSPICLPVPKTTSLQAQSGERSKQTVTANPVKPMEGTSDHRGMSSTSPGPDNRLSDRASQWNVSTLLSCPPDVGYQQRYSDPPYFTLKSTRSPQGDAKNSLPTSPPGFHQQTFSPSCISRPSSLCPDPATNRTSPQSQHTPVPIPPTQMIPLPFPNRSVLPVGLTFDVFKLKEAENNSGKQSCHSYKNTSMSQVDNKAVIGSESLPLQKTLTPSSACLNVIETLVYSISKGHSTASPDNTTPNSLIRCTANKKISVETKPSIQLSIKNSGVAGNQYNPLNQNSNTSSVKEAKVPVFTATDDSSKNSKSPSWKNERTSTARASLSVNQEPYFVPGKATQDSGINKMDHVLSKFRQTFSGKRSDDLTCSPKCNQSSKTPSISGSSDGNNSDIAVKSNDMLERHKEGERMEIQGDTNGELERREMEKGRGQMETK